MKLQLQLADSMIGISMKFIVNVLYYEFNHVNSLCILENSNCSEKILCSMLVSKLVTLEGYEHYLLFLIFDFL